MSHVNHESWTFLFMPLILDFVRFSSVIFTGRDITGSLPIILAYSFFFALLFQCFFSLTDCSLFYPPILA